MKNKFYAICLFWGGAVLGLAPTSASAQECRHPLGLTKNTEFVYQVTDRNKKDGTLHNKVMQQGLQADGAFVTTIKTVRINNKNRPEGMDEFTVRCQGDSIYLDAILLLREQALKTFDGSELEFIPKDLAYPHQLYAGQKLPDGQLAVRVKGSSANITKVNMRAVNRKVEGQQTLTTPAGTFDTYRITYQYVVKLNVMDMDVEETYQVEEFYSPEYGIVKLQFTNKKGKKAKGIELISKKDAVQALHQR